MATETKTIIVRADTAANWASSDPTMAAGEWGYDTTNNVVRIGDGATAWSSLPDVLLGDSGDTLANLTALADADQVLVYDDSASAFKLITLPNFRKEVDAEFVVAASDETTALTTGTGKVTFRMPYAMTVTEVRASVVTAPVGAALQVDVNEGGASIFSTVLSIDDGEKTSTTAATPAVISDAALADDAEITIDIDQIGSSTAGAGLKVAIKGYRA